MGKPMTGSDISRELCITRQAVSQTLKSGLRKLYYEILRTRIADTPFDAVCAMMCAFGLNQAPQDEIDEFLILLPNDVRRLVKEDAQKQRI